jgi:4-amino-4-deoxychorismate lyase
MRPQLIETVLIEADGRMPLLPLHLERLGESCGELSYRWSVDAAQRAIARAAATVPEGQPHRLRLLASDDGAVEVGVEPLAPMPAQPRVRWADSPLYSREPMLRYKTTWRPWYDNAVHWLACHPDHFDQLFCNEHGELCEGSRSNVYVLMDGKWLTPPLSCGLLPGVQRAALLDDERVEEAVLRREDVARAQGLRLSNALRGWFDVVLDDKA